MRGTHSIFATPVGLTAALVLVSTTGCAGQRSTYEKQVSALEDEVTVLQNANDRLEERVAALELAQVTRSKQGQAQAETPARPELEVVKLAPEPGTEPPPRTEPEASPEAPKAGKNDAPEAPRPLIHGTGESIEAKMPEGPTSLLGPDRSRRAGGGVMEHTDQTTSRPCTRRART
jgi:exonuclease VII small subunit